jgi:hypothetical protein
MQIKAFTLAIFATTLSQGQPIHLQGRVLDQSGLPVSGAMARLESIRITSQTGVDGRFTLATPVSTFTGKSISEDVTFRASVDHIVIHNPRGLSLAEIEWVNVSGSLAGSCVRRLDTGDNRIDFADALASGRLTSGVYKVRVKSGGKLVYDGAYLHDPALKYRHDTGAGRLTKSGAGGSTEAIDSLSIVKEGYQTLVVQVNNTVGKLGDILLVKKVECGVAPLMPSALTGGCNIRLVTPALCEEIDLSEGKAYQFAWTTDGAFCETPWELDISGTPMPENNLWWKLNKNSGYITSTGGVISVTADNIAPLISNDGIYHWIISGYYGSHPASQAFRVRK